MVPDNTTTHIVGSTLGELSAFHSPSTRRSLRHFLFGLFCDHAAMPQPTEPSPVQKVILGEYYSSAR